MKPLSGVDAAFLHLETPETPMHVASLHLFDMPPGYRGDFHADVKQLLAGRLHLAPVFRRKLAPMPLQLANPLWVEAKDVDLDYHVQRVKLPRPGTQAQLETLVGRLHGELLDRARPLWRIFVIDGLKSGQTAYYIKVHHAVLDGQAGVQLAYVLFDLEPKPRKVPRAAKVQEEHPHFTELAAAAVRHDAAQYVKFVRHLPEVIKTLAGMIGGPGDEQPGDLKQNFAFGPATPLNVAITGERGFAGVSIPLAEVKQIAAASGAKVNDVVLALCSGALRRYLAHHGGIPDKPLIASMPISLRAAGNTDYNTQATLSLVNLETHIADPLRRLAAIRDAAGAMKSLAGKAKSVIPTDFPSMGVPWLLHGLASLYGRVQAASPTVPIANLVISNVPGPQVPLYGAGGRMTTYWPLSIVEHGLGLNITVLSYAGEMGFGFTTAKSAVPNSRKLADALLEAHEELKQCALPEATRVGRLVASAASRKRRKAA